MESALNPSFVNQFFPKNEAGEDTIRLGFHYSFRFPNGFRKEARRRAALVAQDYWSLCGQHLRLMTTPLKHHWKNVPQAYSMEDWLQAHPQEDWVWQMLFHSGPSPKAAAEYQIAGLGNSTEVFSYSHLFLYVPPTWFAETGADPLALYLRWAPIMQAHYGTAGLGLVPAEDTPTRGSTFEIAHAFATQFPGVELADSLGNHNALWGLLAPNWLNLIDSECVERLGGLARIREQLARERLADQVGVYPFDGGLILVSGERPQLCESGRRREVPSAYGPAARLLKPLRTDRPWGCWGCPKSESLDWLARFDNAGL